MKKISFIILLCALVLCCASCTVPKEIADKLPDTLLDKLPAWLPIESTDPETPDEPTSENPEEESPKEDSDENTTIPEDTAIPEGTSILDARAAAAGQTLELRGVVAAITYAFGKVPSGFYLVDTTGSIYVYGKEAAASVKVGNTVVVSGTKAYWILEKEQASAEAFGYRGCNQIENATVLSNDNGNTLFSKKGVYESSLKDILSTPVTEDITTNIYKVTALVKKVAGTGFTNYYFFDIDGETGSYTYTQCNGSDFAWLDAYDGHFCTVYLSPINAKSDASGCYYRLLPIALEKTELNLSAKEIAQYALKYHAFENLMPSYAADPAIEMVSTVSSELLGFTGATVSYTSSDTGVVYFETVGGTTVLHTNNSGRITVTATATYNGESAEATYEITVLPTESFESVSVGAAVDAQIGDTLTVEGIVGPSLVNKTGFYLIDATGVIAVQCTDSQIAELRVGDRIVIEATREVKTKGGSSYFGQSYLQMDTLLANYYGAHAYSDASFVSGMTADEFYSLNPLEDYSTTVFVITATVRVVVESKYSNVYIDGDSKSITLYCSSADQYSFLKDFDGQEVTLEIAACNWNDKSYWRGCVLAVRTESGKVINMLNFS